MAKYKKASWKDKIDPAFDEFIKKYINFLGLCHISSDYGYLCPDDKTLKELESKNYPALDKQYDIGFGEIKKAVPDLIKLGVNKNVLVTAKPICKDISKLDKYILNLYSPIPDGPSKDHYKKRFMIDKSQKEIVAELEAIIKGKTPDKANKIVSKIIKDMNSDILSLYIHILFSNMKKLEKPLPAKERKNVNELRLTRIMLINVYNTLSLLMHKRPMKKLIEEGRNGDDKALFKAIQIDKTLFNAEWVRKRIIKAQYKGDNKFFDKLGDAIKKTPLQNDVEYVEVLLVLMFFWKMGLYRLTIPELMKLLESAGLRLQDDAGSFRKFVNDYKKRGALIDS